MKENDPKAAVERARVLRGALELKPVHHVVPKMFEGFTPQGLEQLRRVLERARQANRGPR